ncbi:MAG: hypothetical protein ACOX5R_22410 [bacterium]
MRKVYFEAVSLCLLLVMASTPVLAQGIFTGTADWDRADGSKVPGSVEVTGSGTDAVYTLVGDGNDIWDAADEGFFVYTTETGSWAIQGKFTWVDPGADVWSKFGPMVRADAESPGSPNFFMAARGNLGANDLVSPQWRLSQDGSSASHGPRVRDESYNLVVMDDTQSIWLRVGHLPELNLVYGEYSFDGQDWKVGYSRSMDLPDTSAFGLAITDHQADALTATGTATGVELVDIPDAPWASRTLPPYTGAGKTVDITINILTPGSFTLTENVPQGWEVIEASNGGSIAGNTITWNLDASVNRVTYLVRVSDNAAPGSPVGFSGTCDGNNILGDQVTQFWSPSPVAEFDGWIQTGNANMGQVNDFGDYIELVQDGADIEGSQDHMLFLFKQLEGNFSVYGTVELFSSANDWSKAGLMVRDNLNDNSANIFAMQRTLNQEFRWQTRLANGGGTTGGTLIAPSAASGPPLNFRIDRVKNVTAVYYENTSGEWENIGILTLENLEDPVFAGFALTSHADGTTAFAEVQNFSVEVLEAVVADVQRSFPVAQFVQDQPITGIQLQAVIPEGQTGNGIVTETPPAGWQIANAQATGGTVEESNGSLVWDLTGATGSIVLTYDVTPAQGATQGTWSGSASYPDLDFDFPISGSASLTAGNATFIYFVYGESLDLPRNSVYIDLLTDGLTLLDTGGQEVTIPGLGYEVTPVNQSADNPADVSRFDLVFVNESVGSDQVAQYIDQPVPYLTNEQIFAAGRSDRPGSMFFGPQAGVDTSAGDFEYEIVGEHPITDLWNVGDFIEITRSASAQLAGVVVDQLAEAGTPLAQTGFVAGALRYSLIIADEGATGFGGAPVPAGAEPAPARRAYLGYHELTVVPEHTAPAGPENVTLTTDGAILFQRVVQWLLGVPVTADGTEGGVPVQDWALY